jgi:hypothetical protein
MRSSAALRYSKIKTVGITTHILLSFPQDSMVIMKAAIVGKTNLKSVLIERASDVISISLHGWLEHDGMAVDFVITPAPPNPPAAPPTVRVPWKLPE